MLIVEILIVLQLDAALFLRGVPLILAVRHIESDTRYLRVVITTRVKEMDFDTEKMLTGAVISTDGDELDVKTNIVERASFRLSLPV